VEIDFQAYFTSIPHRKLLTLIAKRIADGSLLTLSKQTLTVGGYDKGQGGPAKVGGPQGSPISPLYSNIYLNLLDQRWHSRGYPTQLGATLPAMRMIVRQAMCTRDEGRSLAAGLRRPAANHRKRLGSRASVVSVTEKARHDLVREETERRTQVNH
jgi:retron-type reverse transcriptase